MDNRLEGRIAVVTGASSGLGRATALRFAACGARVVCADMSSGSNDTAEEIRHKHGEDRATFVSCNVTKESEIENLISQAVAFGGRLDIICNYAGVATDAKYPNVRVHDLPTEDFDLEFAVNTRGVWLCCKYALKQMLAQEPRAPNARGDRTRGWIVNAASIAGYTPSKFAVVGMTKQMAIDYALDRIHVNAVCPGFVETPMIDSLMSKADRYENTKKAHPWNALGQADDVANAALYLCSDESYVQPISSFLIDVTNASIRAWVTGHTLHVDGGYTAR